MNHARNFMIGLLLWPTVLFGAMFVGFALALT